MKTLPVEISYCMDTFKRLIWILQGLRPGSGRSLQDGGKGSSRGGSGAIYKVAVMTGDKKNAGTDARVSCGHHPLV